MTKTEILEELPKLSEKERAEIMEHLLGLQVVDRDDDEPSDEVKALLDEALAAHERNPDAGKPWREVMDRLTAGRHK